MCVGGGGGGGGGLSFLCFESASVRLNPCCYD